MNKKMEEYIIQIIRKNDIDIANFYIGAGANKDSVINFNCKNAENKKFAIQFQSDCEYIAIWNLEKRIRKNASTNFSGGYIEKSKYMKWSDILLEDIVYKYQEIIYRKTINNENHDYYDYVIYTNKQNFEYVLKNIYTIFQVEKIPSKTRIIEISNDDIEKFEDELNDETDFCNSAKSSPEGTKKTYSSTYYERNPYNRKIA